MLNFLNKVRKTLDNCTPIYALAEEGKWEEVKSILEKEPRSIRDRSSTGSTVGWLALKKNDLPILKYLVSKGLNLEALDHSGRSLLQQAVHNGSIETVEYLVGQQVDLNHQDYNLKHTALHFAAAISDFEKVKVLVNAGASLDLKDRSGNTADEIAKRNSHQQIYEYLVAAKQQRSMRPATTSSIPSEAASRIEELETQLHTALTQIENLKLELMQSTLKTDQLQLQLRHVLATIPYEQLKAIKLIGRGGFAEVSLVEWQSKQYAFKCFHDEETASMCLKEASVAMSLSCPYIVHIYGKTEEPAGMLVEYMNKGSLFTVLFKSKLTLSLPQKKQIALAVGNALTLMHDRGVLHRDIKPDNVLIHGSEDNSELYAKVADFGTAKLINTKMTLATTGTSAFTGTLNFMAPELLNAAIAQIQAEVMGETSTSPPVTATKECDVYSFGVLLYELICEKQAYQGIAFSSGIQFMKHMASGKRPEVPNNCPAGWKALIEKCWHQDPKHRPTMKEVLGDLKKMSP